MTRYTFSCPSPLNLNFSSAITLYLVHTIYMQILRPITCIRHADHTLINSYYAKIVTENSIQHKLCCFPLLVFLSLTPTLSPSTPQQEKKKTQNRSSSPHFVSFFSRTRPRCPMVRSLTCCPWHCLGQLSLQTVSTPS